MSSGDKTNQQTVRAQVAKQLPLLEAQTTWFHIFKSMVDSGDIAKMGPYATTVYMVIKAYTNWKTGKSWPGVDLIVEKTGMSKRKVIDCLQILEANGYITKDKVGRSNKYTLREKVTVTDEDGRPQAEAIWDYLPSTVSGAVAELKNFVATGKGNDLKIIHIEHLTLNLQQNFDCTDIDQNNMTLDRSGVDRILKLPDDNPIKRAFLASKSKDSSDLPR